MARVTVTLPEEVVEYAKEKAEETSGSKAMVIRQLAWKGYIESKIEEAIQKYKNMELTIRGAAKFAGVDVREFYDILEKKGIKF
jgi:predicted HTH domain antitoxin